MCGICGILVRKTSVNAPSNLVRSMGDALSHRGPDANGCYHDPVRGVFFEHRRLAIIDLSAAGRQPLYNEDRTVVVMVNGEIYNYRELREQLTRRGHRFASQCDVETVVHLFEEQGIGGWKNLRGMFAIAVYDTKSGELYLTRDSLGIKPLYVYESSELIAFSSEIRGFQALPNFASDPNPDGWMDFLLLGSVPAPRTHLKNIRALLPGETLTIRKNQVLSEGSSPISAWCHGAAEATRSEASAARECIRDSVRKHLVSDVPIGIFLSGGMDSGALAGIASEISTTPVHTVSVTLPGHALDESALAHQTAEVFGTHHVEIPLDQASFEADFHVFFDHLDLPSIDGFNTFIVSKVARAAGLTVALSGLGGDEIFAGYNSFQLVPRLTRLHQIASWGGSIGKGAAAFLLEKIRHGSSAARVAEIFRSRPANIRSGYLACRGLFVGRILEDLLAPELRSYARAAHTRFLDETSWVLERQLQPRLAVAGLELSRYMSSQLLRDTDVMSMAHGLEVRTPLVDVEVVRGCLPFLAHDFEGDGHPKWLLRQSLDRPLPASVVQRPKRGFVFPWQEWMSGFVLKDFDRKLASPNGWADILQPKSVQWWRDAYVRGWAHWSCFWALYVLMKFLEKTRGSH